MSLLLDARKKIELALQHSDAHAGIEDFPAGMPQKKTDESPHAAQRAANLFAAKAAPARTGGRLGIIPIALISGLVLAAGGGYYVWREISPPPMQRHNSAPAPKPSEGRMHDSNVNPAQPEVDRVANTTPPAVPAAQAVSAPAPAVERTHAQANARMKKSGRTPVIAASSAPPPVSPHPAAQSIRIDHASQSDTVDPTLLAAWQAYRNDDLRTAWQHYGDVLRKDAKNRDALLGMAAIAQQQSQDAVAARYYNQVLTLDPRDPVANAGMLALLGASDAAATESRLKLLLAQQPQPTGSQSSALYFALGNLYAEQSRWGDAQQAYFNAYKLEQDNAQFAFNLAVSLDHMGQGKLAAQHYQRALQLDASDNPGFNRAQTQQRINELTAP